MNDLGKNSNVDENQSINTLIENGRTFELTLNNTKSDE